MTVRETHRFRKALEGIKLDLDCALQGSLDRIVVSHDTDPMDQLVSRIERDKDSRLVRLLITRMHLVDDALSAIRQGNFGYCAVCGAPIPLKHLQAAPWSLCCFGCLETAGRDEKNDERDRPLEPCRSGPQHTC
jgi:RNA polymerase-binding transcription factor DksA